jgi:hypothetical protein
MTSKRDREQREKKTKDIVLSLIFFLTLIRSNKNGLLRI